MRGLRRQLSGIFAAGVLASLSGACSTDQLSNLTNVNLLPKVDQITRPDWLTYSGGKEEFTLRPAGPEDLVGPQGECSVTAEQVAAAQAARANVDVGAGGPRESQSDDPPEIPLQSGGIALQMTECDVVRRVGRPERVEFNTGDRGERTVVITYIRGERPGIYRFAGGRLYSIERAPEAPSSAKQKAKPAKKKTNRS